MGLFTKIFGFGLGAAILSACATTDPYAAAYDACDREAGACYADCRALDAPDRREACQRRCTTAVNRCFAQVRQDAERYSRYRVAPDYVFYGRYGAWYPYDGYRYGRHGRRYSYNGYYYDRWGYDRWGYDRYGYDRYGYDYHGRRRGPGVGQSITGAVCGDGRCRGGWGDDGRSDGRYSGGPSGGGESRGPSVSVPDDDRYQTEDGSVFRGDGQRLRYGGEPGQSGRSVTNGVRATGRTANPMVKSAPTAPQQPAAKPTAPTVQPKARPTRPRSAPRARPKAPSNPRSDKPSRIEP